MSIIFISFFRYYSILFIYIIGIILIFVIEILNLE